MKSLLVSTSIIIVLIISWIFIYSFISESIAELNSLLEDMENKINNNNWKLAVSIHNTISKKWKNKQKLLLLFIEHKEIENVNLALEKINKYIYLKNKPLTLGEAANLKYLLNHVKEKETLSLQNIF